MNDTVYGTLTIFMYVTQPTTNPDRPAQRGRRTLYKQHYLSQEEAQNQTLAFVHNNKDRIKPDAVYATWQPEPVELETR